LRLIWTKISIWTTLTLKNSSACLLQTHTMPPIEVAFSLPSRPPLLGGQLTLLTLRVHQLNLDWPLLMRVG
jgi:hypothetical protein